jgi:hypothetical protein
LVVVPHCSVKERLISAIKLIRQPDNGGDMTADTTFKEFVEEKDLNFSRLDFGSPEYRTLVEAFNKAKVQLKAEGEAREYKEERARLELNEHSLEALLPSCQ